MPTNSISHLKLGIDKRYLEVRNSSHKKIRIGLEVGIENSNEFEIFNVATIHGRFKITRFIALPNHSKSV